MLLFSISVQAKPLKVAVIDTGIEAKFLNTSNLCLTGHKSFYGIDGVESLEDDIGHGTNVIGLINKYAKNANYCIVVIKFTKQGAPPSDSIPTFKKALLYAESIKPDIINISVSGRGVADGEAAIIKRLLDRGVKIVVAAGNHAANMDKDCNYYPACYDERMWVISSNDLDQTNKGDIVDAYLSGKHKKANGHKMSGSSQSTAIFTGKLIKNLSNAK